MVKFTEGEVSKMWPWVLEER